MKIHQTFARAISFAMLALALLVTAPIAVAQNPAPTTEHVRARIESMTLHAKDAQVAQGTAGTFVLKLHDSTQTITLDANIPDLLAQSLNTGDEVIVSRTTIGQRELYQIVDVYRIWPLITLFVVFFALVLYVARWQGIFSFIGMALSFAVILQLIVPQILSGTNAVVVSLLASIVMLPLIFYMAHGFHMKTSIAVASTFVTLCITSILGYAMVHFARLTGLTDEHVFFITALGNNQFAIRDLLFAGFVIGALGVLDDVSISQTSVTFELHDTNPKLTRSQLFARAMRVGRDHVSSLVNTLVLVYAGASLPLFLLFQQQHMSIDMAISSELIATEIVRTLVVSIGVVMSVPITTFAAVWWCKRTV